MAKEKILSGLPKGIQTPSKEDNGDLSIDVICGSLASLIYGEKSVDSPDALRNLLSREPKIYSVISSSISESTQNITKSIKDNIKITKDNISESLLNQTNTLNSSIVSLGESISMSFDVLNATNDAFVEKILESIPQQNGENGSTFTDNKTLEFISDVERQFSLLIQSLLSHQKEFNNALETSLNKLENIDYKLKLDVNVDGNNDIVTLLSNIKNINISDLDAASIQAKNIIGALNNIIAVVSKLNEVDGNTKIDIDNINAILDERETINKIVDNLSNFELNQLQVKDIQAKEIIASINAISNVISKLNEVDGNTKIDIDNINAILNERETINKIVDNLSNFELNQLQAKNIQAKEIIASINAISNVISKLNNITEFEDIDMQKIQKILDQGDAIYNISKELNNLSNINIDLSNVNKLSDISSIVETISNLTKNLSKINDTLEKNKPDFSNVNKLSTAIKTVNIKDLIEGINNVFPKNNKNINIEFDEENIKKLSKSIDILIKFLSLNEIEKVIETSSRKIHKFRKKMFKIGSVYIESVNTLINQLNSDAFSVLDDKKTQSIKQTFSVIDYITSFSMDEDKLDELADTFDYLSYIIEDNLNDFLDTLKDKEFVNKINYIINSKLIDDVIAITENLGKLNEVILPMKTLLSMTIKLAIINKQTEIIGNLIKTLASIENVENAANNLKPINEKILTKLTVKSSENLGGLFASFFNIYKISKKIKFDKLLESTTSLIEILELFKNVKINKDIDKIGVICSGLSKTIIYFGLAAPFVPLAKMGLNGLKTCINNILEVLEQLKDVDTSKIQGIMTDFTKIVIMSGAILIAGGLFMSYIKITDLIAFTVCLGTFIASTIFVYTRSIKDIKDSVGISKDFALLLTLSGAILIAGGLFMKVINVIDLFSFTAALGGFILAVSWAYSIADKTDAFKNAEEFAMLVAMSGAILIAGGLFMKVINVIDLFSFTAALGGFILAVSWAYSIADKTDAFKNAEEFAMLVAISGAILIAGGLFMKVINIVDLLKFGGTLAAFIAVICLAYCIPTLITKFTGGEFNPMKGAKEFGMLVAMSGAILIAGGLFMKVINIVDLLKFGGTLAAFIAVICLAYCIPSIMSKWFKINPMKNAKEFALLVAVSGGILIAGALFMKIIDIEDLITFAATLGGFIFVICLSYGLAGKRIKKSISSAYALAALTAISAAALLIGGYLLMENPGLALNVLIFGSLLVAYIGAMGVVTWLLSKVGKKIGIGLATISGILLVTYGAIKVIEAIKEAVGNGGADYWITLLEGLGSIALLIVAVGGIAFAAGALVAGPQALLFIAGVAAMTTISGVAILAATAVKSVASAMRDINSVKNFDSKSIIDNIEEFISIVDVLEPLSDKAWMITKVSLAMTSMGVMMSVLSNAVQNYASMTVPEYDANGNPTGKKIKLNNKHFQEAADNITTIITTLGGAIVGAYNGKFIINGTESTIECKEMFESNWYSSETIFGKVTRSMSTMGPMLLTLAEAVKDYASLTVPVYDKKGQKIGVRSLKEQDFIDAAENVSKIVTTLGGAVIQAYEDAENNTLTKGMFDAASWTGLGESKFAKVTNALSTMGPMISSIADGVKKYADLRITTYDDNGNPIGTREMKKEDFENAAKHVSQIVSTLGKSVAQVYDDNPLMFIMNQNSNPMLKIAQACTEMGVMIGTIADGVYKYATLEVPEYDKDGKKTGNMIQMGEEHFTKAGDNVSKIITTMGEGIMKAFSAHPDWFKGQTVKVKDGGLFGSDEYKETGSTLFDKVISGCSSMVNLITTVASIVLKFAGQEIEEIVNGKPTGKYLKIGDKEITDATTNVTKIFGTFSTIMDDVSKNKLFTDGENIDSIKSKVNDMISIINSSAKAIQDFSNMNFGNDNIDSIGDSLQAITKIHHLLFESDKYDDNTFTAAGKWTFGKTFYKEFASSDEDKEIKQLNATLKSVSEIVLEIIKANESIKKEIGNSDAISTANIVNMLNMCEALSTIKGKIDSLFIKNQNADSSFLSSIKNAFTESDETKGFKQLYKTLNSVSEIVLQITKTNESLNNEIAKSNILDTEKIEDICNAFVTIKEKIDSLFIKNENANSSFLSSVANAFTSSDEAETNKKFKLYLRNINDFIDLGDRTSGNIMFGWQQIALGIGIINDTVNKIAEEGNDKFKEHIDSIDKYITKINTLDMSKVNSLTNLINSLNLLAFKMGNLDNFTEALSQKLSSVLKDLTDQLKEADASITKAKKLQESRKKAIEDSVNKIKEIMNQTLSVEISKKDENDTSGGGGGAPTPTTPNSNSGGSGSSEMVPTGEVDSPTTTNRTEEQGKRAKQSSSTNVSTEVAKAISTVFGSGVKAKINNKEVILTT